MSEISSASSAGPIIIESTNATVATSTMSTDTPSAAPMVAAGALASAAPVVDMRAAECPSTLLGKAPKGLIKV